MLRSSLQRFNCNLSNKTLQKVRPRTERRRLQIKSHLCLQAPTRVCAQKKSSKYESLRENVIIPTQWPRQTHECFAGQRRFLSVLPGNGDKETNDSGIFTSSKPLFSKDLVQDSPPLILGTGKIANLTKASVLAVMGDSVVLTTVAAADSEESQDSLSSFRNLTVEYRQRHHGVGKIPTASASRRDNDRFTPTETLGSRAIDRALRPLLREDEDKQQNSGDIHIHSSVQGCSATDGNPIVLAINSASAALMTHDMLQEPVAAVSLGVVAGNKQSPKVLFNPSPLLQQEENALACELLYAGTRTHSVMAEFQYHRQTVEGDEDGGVQTSIPEDELVQLMSLAHAAIQPLLDTQEEFIQNNKKGDTLLSSEGNEKRMEEENELRASLGLPPVPIATSEDDVDPLKIKQRASRLLEEATIVCERQLKDATLALFGNYNLQDRGEVRTKEKNSTMETYKTAYVHNASHAPLAKKSTRGRREQIISQEIERILTDWITEIELCENEHGSQYTLIHMLREMVHKKLLRRALCTTAIEYGTRADHRCGGQPFSPNEGFRTVRPLSLTVPALPDLVHGSALFARGDTQVLCTATLGPPRDGIPNRDPFLPPLPTPALKQIGEKSKKNQGDGDTTGITAFEDLPVGSLRYLRTQEALVSDLNSRKSKADKEMTGDSGSLWEYRRAFLQYDFPSFSTGEMPKGSGMAHNRRAIGHGALAEKAILSVLPSPHDFPYAVRITSEVTDSNGSSSMASVCGATLALLDAGVPIVAPVAGVSVGLALMDNANNTGSSGDRRYELLLDITGTEDHYGAMDFKIAGTMTGVTAFQLDVKEPLPLSVLQEALELGRAGRRVILREMDALCKNSILQGLKARISLKDTAPRVEIVRFDPQRKRDLIGPGGAVLRQLEDRYNVSLDLTQEGQCLLFGSDKDMVAKARSAVADLVADVEVGEVYEGTIIEIKDFGAIVELLRNKSGLLHVSELASNISHPEGNLGAVRKHLKVGDKIKVLCTGVDPVQDSIRLSVKALYAKDGDDSTNRSTKETR